MDELKPDKALAANIPLINQSSDGNDTEDENPTKIYINNTLKQRSCKRFVADKKDNSGQLCSCGYGKKQHIDSCTYDDRPDEPWKAEVDTTSFPTDAFGEFDFVTTGLKICKYVRVENKTNVDDLLTLMLKYWNMEKPNLLISVTGGAQKFKMNQRLKDVFRQGLVKAAYTTRAWIITGGTNKGVMKHVGEAVQDYTLKYGNKKPLVALGIATWGCIENNDDLRSKSSNGSYPGKWPGSYRINETQKARETPLDPNHTHFILVDDGTRHKFGVEIKLRAKLENAVSKMTTLAGRDLDSHSVSVPVVCVVLEGGPNTIETVRMAIYAGTPVIIVEGSGRAADILAHAYNGTYKDTDVPDEFSRKQSMSSFVSEDQEDQMWREIEDMIRESFKTRDDKQLQDIVNNVRACIQKIDYMTVFSLDGKGQAADIDITILRALLKVNGGKKIDQLRLALAWNRIDVATDEIYTEDVRFEDLELHDLLFKALLNDSVEFVKLFIEKGVDLKPFLTRDRLTELYNDDTIKTRCRRLKKLSSEEKKITLRDVGSFLKNLIRNLFEPAYCRDSCHAFEDPFKELFIWCILMRMKEMAMVFWNEGKERIALSLLANLVLKSLLVFEKDTELTQELQEQVDFFGELATELLAECYSTEPSKTMRILLREMPSLGNTTALKLAVQADNKSFVAHPACQNLLTDIWTGDMTEDNHYITYMISVLLFPIAPFLLKYREKERKLMLDSSTEKPAKSKDSGIYKQLSKMESKTGLNGNTSTTVSSNVTDLTKKPPYLDGLVSFFRAPCVKFAYHCISYFAFLLLFGVILLTDFFPTIRIKEVILIFWLLTMTIDEITQLVTDDAGDFRLKFYNYIKDGWNILDVITIATFLTGMALRFIPITTCGQCFYAARIILALNLMTFFFRILHMFSIHRELGPKLVMIGQMMIDLFYFMIVLMVFVAAYGVASHVILYPNQPLDMVLARDVLSQPWWDVLQQFKVELVSGEECQGPTDGPYSGKDCASLDYDAFDETCIENKARKCPANSWLVPIVLAMYALITNVMMINLLIAIFSNTFAELQGQANVIWKMQRYHLVKEYDSRPFLPPPFIVIVHVLLFIRYLLRHSSLDGHLWKIFKKNASAFDRDTLTGFEEMDLIKWENLNAEEYIRKKSAGISDSAADNKARETNERFDVILRQFQEIFDTNVLLYAPGSNVQAKLPPAMEERFQYLEKQMQRTAKALDWITANMNSSGGAPPLLPDVDTDVKKEKEQRELEHKKKIDLSEGQFQRKARLHRSSKNVSTICYSAPRSVRRFQISEESVSFEPPSAAPKPEAHTENDDSNSGFQISWIEPQYKTVDGLPENPRGRTGLKGKGILEHLGPNHVANVVITRWKKKIDHPEFKELVFISVKCSYSNFPSIPEAPATYDDYRSAVRECFERVLENVSDDVEKLLTNNEMEICRDYLDDHRNTDNAWLETITLNYHIEDSDVYDKVTIKSPDAEWTPIRSTSEVYGSHILLLKRVAESFKEATF